LDASEIEANGAAYGALLAHRTSLENTTTQVFVALIAVNGLLYGGTGSKNIAIAAGIASVIGTWLFSLLPIRRKWFNAELDGFATKEILKHDPARFSATRQFRNPRSIWRYFSWVDALLIGMVLFWIAQIPRVANRLEPALEYLWRNL